MAAAALNERAKIILPVKTKSKARLMYYRSPFGTGNPHRTRWLLGPTWLERWGRRGKDSGVEQEDDTTTDSSGKQDEDSDDDTYENENDSGDESSSDADRSSESNDEFAPRSMSTPYRCDADAYVNPNRKRKLIQAYSVWPSRGKRMKLDDEEFDLYGKLISSKLRNISQENRKSFLQLQSDINTLLLNEELKVLKK